jgi:dihydroorotase
VRLLREAKSRGLRVSAEVTPHHLALTDEALLGYDTHCKVNPPLRSDEDREAVRAALADGTIDCVATDHAPHCPMDKDCEFEAASVGINGLETAVAVLLGLVRDETLSPLRFVEVMSTAPARLVPELDAGRLVEGARGDITVVDPEIEWTLDARQMRSKSSNTPWIGKPLRGRVTTTVVEGVVVYDGSDAGTRR